MHLQCARASINMLSAKWQHDVADAIAAVTSPTDSSSLPVPQRVPPTAALTAAEADSLCCVEVEVMKVSGHAVRRLGVVTQADLAVGCVVERCYARILPRWQASEDFVWSCGAYPASHIGIHGHTSSMAVAESKEVVLPFGWGMLYADARRNDLPANLKWSVEVAPELHSPQEEVEEGEEQHQMNREAGWVKTTSNYLSNGYPCWLVLVASRLVGVGEELVVDRCWPTPPEAGPLDIVSYALSLLDPDDLLRPHGPPLSSCLGLDMSGKRMSLSHPAALPCKVQASVRHGVGVFAARPIACGEVVEVAPVVLVADREVPTYKSTSGRFCHAFSDYTYDSRLEKPGMSCFSLGFVCLQNHSTRPNIEQKWAYPEDAHEMYFHASEPRKIDPDITRIYAQLCSRCEPPDDNRLEHLGSGSKVSELQRLQNELAAKTAEAAELQRKLAQTLDVRSNTITKSQ